VKCASDRRSLLQLSPTSTWARVAFYKLRLRFSTTHNSLRSINSHREAMPKTDWSRCVACDENFEDASKMRWEADCGHRYCATCIEALLRSSLVGGPFSPQCCGLQISFWTRKDLKTVLPEDLKVQLAEKQDELESWDRTYCSVPACSTFIRAGQISGKDATCSVCKVVTCVTCKAASHTGKCPTDEGMQQVLLQAVDNGWMSCKRCKSVVDRIEGCNEMM
jgi:hypothetical protein